MPSAETLDFAALLVPIPGDKPSGQSVRYSGEYDSIQNARRAEDEVEQGDWKREVKKADWQAVIAQAVETLSTKSKDLQIVAWLTEALVKRHGFPGLRDGLRLIRELHEGFWDSLYPEIDAGDLEYRAGPLWWLNEKLPFSIKAIPLMQSKDGQSYSWLHWEESRAVDTLGRRDPQALTAALADGKITADQFDAATMVPPRAYYETLFADLSQSWEECARLQQVVDQKFGRDAPSLLNAKKVIEDCRTLVEGILRKKRELEPDPVLDSTQAGDGSVPPEGNAAMTAPHATGNLPLTPVDRNDALRRLAAVSEFFHRTEPHSPVAYLVQRAVRWGQMPLEQWLQDVIADGTVLANVRETLGLKDTAK